MRDFEMTRKGVVTQSLTETNNCHRNITFMNLLFGFSIIKKQPACIFDFKS